MGIRSSAKQIESFFNNSLRSQELLLRMQISGVLFIRPMPLSFHVFQESFEVLCYDLQVCLSDRYAPLKT